MWQLDAWFKMHYAEFLADNSDNGRVLIFFNVNCLFPADLTHNVPAGNCDNFLWYNNFEN